MVICPRCQAQNPDGMMQCGRCGYPLVQQGQMVPYNPTMMQQDPYANPSVPPMPEQNPPVKNSQKTKSNKMGIILLVFCLLLLISNVATLWVFMQARTENEKQREAYEELQKTAISNMTKSILESTDDELVEKIDKDPNSPDGTIAKGDLWNFYYGKTKDEVMAIAPSFTLLGDGIYKLDSGYLIDEESEMTTELYGSFSFGMIRYLSFHSTFPKNVCGVNNLYNTVNEEDYTLINSFAALCLMKMGLLTDDNKGQFSGNSVSHPNLEQTVITTPEGIKCVFPNCPGNELTFSCEF